MTQPFPPFITLSKLFLDQPASACLTVANKNIVPIRLADIKVRNEIRDAARDMVFPRNAFQVAACHIRCQLWLVLASRYLRIIGADSDGHRDDAAGILEDGVDPRITHDALGKYLGKCSLGSMSSDDFSMHLPTSRSQQNALRKQKKKGLPRKSRESPFRISRPVP